MCVCVCVCIFYVLHDEFALCYRVNRVTCNGESAAHTGNGTSLPAFAPFARNISVLQQPSEFLHYYKIIII